MIWNNWNNIKWLFSNYCCCCSVPSHVRLFATPWTAACQASLALTISWSLPKFMFIASVKPFSLVILWHSLLLPSIFPSIRDFSSELSDGQKTGASSSVSVLPVNIQTWSPLRLTGLISLLSKGLSEIFSSTTLKESILLHSAFFVVQFSQPYVTTGKTIALTIRTFVGRVIMFLLFNTLSRFAICFLPRSHHLLIPWLQSPSTVILEPKKRKSWLPPFPLLFAMQ